MQDSATTAARRRANRPTGLLRDILTISEQFQQHLGNTLSVNPTDLDAMQQLIMHGPLAPTEISHRLNISTAAVTAVIDRLIAVGHVTRQQHPTDRRSVLVVANPQSRQTALATLMPMVLGIDRVLDTFDDNEKLTIERYLAEVATIYREHVPENVRNAHHKRAPKLTRAGEPKGNSPAAAESTHGYTAE